MEVDTEERRIWSRSCDEDHVVWCERVAFDALMRKVSEITVPRRNDIEKINDLLKWKDPGVFMRPSFEYQQNGLTAHQCFWDWDTKGVSLPKGLEEPELLADLVQAKKNREFTIDQWVETYEKRDVYPIWPEEYLSHPGMDGKLFKKLFDREPNPDIVRALMREM